MAESLKAGGGAALTRLVADPSFQRLAASVPVVRGLARKDGEAIFSILQGFVASQVLSALMELGLLKRLLSGPASAAQLAVANGVAEDRMGALLRAGVALELLKVKVDGRFALARRGAAILGVPGLEAMIAHNRAFYADMADPVALLRGESETQLARFWPYVMSGGGGDDSSVAARYSTLMAESQALVAADTLRQVSLAGVARLMDVGGGTGAFLKAALTRFPGLHGVLVDLPEVTDMAGRRIRAAGLADRIDLHAQSFRDAPLPGGADAISLVRVLYDHEDATVEDLIAKTFAALPPGGLLVVSEPMSGGANPDPVTDVYFAFYTMAMGTGRVRSQATIAALCRAAGFSHIRKPRPKRPFVTAVVTARKPD